MLAALKISFQFDICIEFLVWSFHFCNPVNPKAPGNIKTYSSSPSVFFSNFVVYIIKYYIKRK